MSRIIRNLNCIECASGILLTWDIADEITAVRTTVYGINKARVFSIETPLVATGRCLISPENYHLADSFKLSVLSDTGELEESDPISPQRMQKGERLIIKEIRRRMQVYMRSTPIGSYPSIVLFRRIDGERCPICGAKECAGRGGEPISDYCPICLGTGIKDPYVRYPKEELFHGESPKDDQDVSQPAAQRSHIVRTFRSVFDLYLRTDDVLVSGSEIYRVIDQKVSASVGGVPAVYALTVMKVPPEDPKYPTLIAIAKGCPCDK